VTARVAKRWTRYAEDREGPARPPLPVVQASAVSTAKPHGASIRIFLVDGTPHGLRVVERAGWTGSCLAFARADFAQARVRPEVGRTGVYILTGPDPSGRRGERVYVGEADEVRVRLDAHQKEKDFWTGGLVLSTTNNSLNKAHVRYLEARLLAIARAADVATVDNGTAPPLPHLSEAEVADMESYLENALVLLPLVGVTVFEAAVAKQVVAAATPMSAAVPGQPALTATATASATSGSGTVTSRTYYLSSAGVNAEALDDAAGFIVQEGAVASPSLGVLDNGYTQLRARLQAQGVLAPDDTGRLRLTKSYRFDSPSAAASVLSGGNRNGRTAWKDEDGRTLRENQERSVV
jgi:hypothetical protein